MLISQQIKNIAGEKQVLVEFDGMSFERDRHDNTECC